MTILSPAFRRLSLCAALLSALATVAPAAITLGPRDNIQVGGFFSQGYLYSRNHNFPADTRGGTWDFRQAAVNVSTTVGARLRLGAQAFSQSLGNIGEDRPILDWAVVDYNVSPALGIRAGRVKYPKGLYGEALDVDAARPFVFLPLAVYNPVLRDFTASFDGAMVYGSTSFGNSSLEYKVFYGDIPMSPRQGVTEFYNDSGLYDQTGATALAMDSVHGGQLAWNTPVSGLRFAYSYSSFTNLWSDGAFAGYPAVNLQANFDHFDWHTVSAEYLWGDWVFAAEWQRATGDFVYAAAPVLPATPDTSGWDGWYVSAARRLSDRFEVGAYYGDLSPNRYNPAPGPRGYQRDTAVSLRFDWSYRVIVKLEAHYLDGTFQIFNTNRLPNPNLGQEGRDVLFAARTTFSF